MSKNDKVFRELYDWAEAHGRDAAMTATPTPMIVVERANVLDDTSPIVKQYAPVMDGVCGFAWVNVKPGNSSFANWLKRNGLARRDSYYGGVTIWVGDYGQSYERKMAHASAMARELNKASDKFNAHTIGKIGLMNDDQHWIDEYHDSRLGFIEAPPYSKEEVDYYNRKCVAEKVLVSRGYVLADLIYERIHEQMKEKHEIQ